MVIIKNDTLYNVTEFRNIHDEVTDIKEEPIITKEAFMLAYSAWVRPNVEWERRLP